ncbi:MAG: alpha/beta hydrolase [Pseudonocardiales bacterium]|nr:alpha/beta hydrolase [Pseudonocardiales bacterium]
MTTKTCQITRPGGRAVSVHELTPDAPAGAPVVLLAHAAPGSGAFDPDPVATAAAGVRLVAPDRPGYGGSDPVAEGFATVDDAAADAATVLERVLEDGATAGVAGWSAGGRVALALAAARPELVGRVAVLGTPAPDEEVPWYGTENRAGLDALRGLPAAQARAALAGMFGPLVAGTPREARAGLVTDPGADAALLADADLAGRLDAMLDVAFAQGATGLADDVAGYGLAPWGVDPAGVRAEVLLGYGGADALVPAEHGRWWAARLPAATLDVVPGVAHLVAVAYWARALAHLTGGALG